MQNPQTPVLKDVVLVGAGHAHVTVLRMFGMDPMPGVRLTLVTRQVHTPYSGMLPGMIAGHYDFDQAHIDTGPLCRFANARLYHAEVTGIDLDAKRILCDGRPAVPYDILSLDIGSTPSGANVPGVAKYAIPVKPIDSFLEHFEAARERIRGAGGRARIAIVGAGAGGVELALSLAGRLRRDMAADGLDPAGLAFTILTSGDHILPAFSTSARGRLERILKQRGIAVRTRARVEGVDDGGVHIRGAAPLAFDEVFWTTAAAAAPWLGKTGLDLDERGFIKVSAALRSTSHADVFAAGDVASLTGFKLPKSGVYAVRQGPVLAKNIQRALTGKTLAAYRPQREALYLVSTGDRYAVGARNGFSVEGEWVWLWKDWIDRRFMDKFNELPEMTTAAGPAVSPIADKDAIKEISAMAMRCGGCGAKVGATVLSRALAGIAPAQRDDVIIGLDAPDDAAVVDVGGPRLSVQTVDYFRAIIDDPFTFGKIAANHALGDVYAMGAEPQTALAIATIPYGLEAKVEADLSALMAGANEILSDAGCALVGGHTSEGAELALGFAVTGLVDGAAALRKGGLEPGDALIVTKPIGTGTLLAAHMRGKAKARWVMAALAHMSKSNRAASAILKAHDAHAATDVTGFGLLGHLVEMVRASDVDVLVRLRQVPLLDGAAETVARGIFSSLQPQNVRLRRAVRNLEEASQDAIFPLLFDPQTAGGLLAAVPGHRAESCVAALRAGGYPSAAIVGRVAPRSDHPASVTIDLSVEREQTSRASNNTSILAPEKRPHAHEPVL